MAVRKPRETVHLTHPSGNFSVDVSTGRAKVLRSRGYSGGSSSSAPAAAASTPGGDRRAALIARAKELGIPAKGTNEALAEAIATAEQA